MQITDTYTEKMKRIQTNLVSEISNYYKENKAIECHIIGSLVEGKNDALSDVDIWITFTDEDIKNVITNRMKDYEQFGEIVLLHEMQNNYPLDGIQTAILYEIEDEIIRVDFYLCPESSSRILPNAKVLFDEVEVPEGNIIPETKRTPRDFSDGVTFLISMCFNTIKNVVRDKPERIDFILDEFNKKYEEKLGKEYNIPNKNSFSTIRTLLTALEENSNEAQKNAIGKIRLFMEKLENTHCKK